MPRDFRSSRFRGKREIGEDVNPSAYIVNLADCMLVLACGFLVALISFWQIDLAPTEQLDQEQLEAIEPEELPADITDGNSYYIEAGTVYQDPNTGLYYIVTEKDENGEPAIGTDAAQSQNGGAVMGAEQGAATGSDVSSPGADDDQICSARSAGAD